jgi:hypothetical protein
MGSHSFTMVNDTQPISIEVYEKVVNRYIAFVSAFPIVKAVYQIGSVGAPGVSDLDLVVVVENCYDPAQMNQLSVLQPQTDNLIKYLFIHDIYLYDRESFSNFHYTNYCDNLILLYGAPQPIVKTDETEKRALFLQIIFDFVSSRLAQFQQFLASRQLSVRGALVRLSSIRHSYKMLNDLGIEDPQIHGFIEKVMDMRKEPQAIDEQEVATLFLESFHQFARVVFLAATYFSENFLNFYSAVDYSNSLRLNSEFTLRFVDETPDVFTSGRNGSRINYPNTVFYHYLAFTKCANLLAEKAKCYLSFSGDESYDLHVTYLNTLVKRLDSISNHLIFLKNNKAFYAMRGHPGFTVALDALGVPKKSEKRILSPPGLYTSPSSASRHNVIIDETTEVEPFERIEDHFDFDITHLEFRKSDYVHWVMDFFPDWKKRYGHIYHKKLIELYATYHILNPTKKDLYMDVAGGFNSYIHKMECSKRYVQGIKISEQLRRFFGGNIEYIQSDAAQIPLPNSSLDKMSCHHSFEHFQGNSDSDFIREIQRLLRSDGKCCIIPVFIADNYVEVSRAKKELCPFDKRAEYIVDPSARITGGESCGDYARIYDIAAFHERIIDRIDRSKFRTILSEISFDGKLVPDFSLPCHSGITKVNYPYRTLTIERVF